jgi:flagellar biosynthetic protein FlhB
MAAGAQEKTEKPTAKKLRKARQGGKVAKSRDLNTILVLVVGAFTIYASSGSIAHHFRQLAEKFWGDGFSLAVKFPPDVNLLFMIVSHFSMMVFPTISAIMIVAIAANLAQTKGFLFSFEAIKPELSKLNPLQGFKRFLSLRSFIELAKSLLKITIISYLVYSVYRSEQHLLGRVTGKEVEEIFQLYAHLAWKVLIKVAAVMGVFAMLDFYYQRWQYEKDLRMSKQEVKEEHKESEGSPQIKARIRAIQRSMAQQRTMANVPKASVVITNPTHFAVALLYNSKMEAPKVVAKGADLLAKKIIKIARKHSVPVVPNPPLARALYSEVKVDGSIPVTLYKAVAKVLAYIYRQTSHKPS